MMKTKSILGSCAAICFAAFVGTSLVHSTLYWDVNDADPGSGNAGGIWSTDPFDPNWSTSSDGDVATGPWIQGSNAVFSAGTDGTGTWTVTIDGTIVTPSILFEETGTKTITGGIIEIGGGSISSTGLPLSGGDDIVINSILAGSGGLTIAAHGDATSDGGGGSGAELRLNGENTFTGGFTVTRGVVSFTNSAAFGDPANSITLDGGGILMNSGGTTALPRDIIAGPAGGTIRLYGGANVLNHSGSLTGSTSVRRTDGGLLNMNGDGSGFTGTWNNRGGDTAFASTDWSQMTLDSRAGGRVFFTNTGTSTVKEVTTGRDLFINNGGRLDIESGTLNLVTGAGFWVQTSNSGSLTTSSGTLTVTGGEATGNLTTAVHAIRVIIEDESGGNPLALVKNNNNSLILDRVNTYTGGTTINGGRINADNTAVFGTGTVTVNAGGQAYLTQAGSYANDFVINGIGVTEGAGNLGALRFQGSTVSGDIEVASAARISADGASGIHTGTLVGGDDLGINAPGRPGVLTFSGDTSGYTGTVTLNAGTLNVGDLGGSLTLAAGTVNLSGAVPGTTLFSGGSTLNLLAGSTIGAPGIDTDGPVILRVGQGSTVDGDVISDFDQDDNLFLDLAGTVTGNVTIDGGSSMRLNGGSIGGNLISGTFFNDLIPVAFAETVDVGGNLTVEGVQQVTLQTIPAPGVPLDIITYGGNFTGDIEDFELVGTGRAVVFSDTGSAITLDLGGSTRTWVGDDATNPTFWDTESTPNWAEGDNLFFTGDAVLFDDTATGYSVAMQGGLSPFSVTFDNATENYAVTGPGFITGSTGISINGGAQVTLGGANTYTGPVAVNAGALVATSAQALGLTSGLGIADGARLNINGQALGNGQRAYVATIEGDGGDGAGALVNTGGGVASNAGFGGLILSGDATVGGTGRFDLGLANGFPTSPRFIEGNGHTLTKTGTNQIVIRGPATDITYVVNEGSLTFEDFDSASGTEIITVNGGILSTWGTRTLNNDVVLADGVSFGSVGGGTSTWNGDISMAGDAAVLTTSNLILNGSITGSGEITRGGGNILFLQGDNSGFTGRVINSAGILRLLNDSALGGGTGADVLEIGGSTLEGGTPTAVESLTLNANQGITQTGNVVYNPGANNTMTINAPVTGTGNITKLNNNGTLVFNAPVSTTNANLTAEGGTIDINQGVTLTTDASAAVLRSANANVMNLAGNSNVRRLQVATGTMNIGPGAAIVANSFETSNGGGTQSVVNQTGGTLTITGTNSANSTARSNLFGHWGSGSSSTYNMSGGEFTSLGAFIGLGWDSPSTIVNQSGGVVTSAGIGIGGRNNFGQYNLTGGELYLGSLGINGTASNKEINLGGGRLGAFANWGSAQAVVLTGDGGDVTIDTLDAIDDTTPRNITLSGGVSGPGGFVKTGPGALVLGGNKTYEGDALIEEGLLVANGTLPGTLTIEEGAALLAGTSPVGISVQTLSIGGSFDNTVIEGQVIMDLNAIDETPGGVVNDLIEIPGDVEFGPNSTILPRFFGGPVQSGNVYEVMRVDGNRTGLPIVDPAIADNVRFDFTVLTGAPPFDGDILLEISGEAGELVWTGAQNFLWNTNIDQNWTINGTPTEFKLSDAVTFDDTGDSSSPVELVEELFVGQTTIDASSDYTFAGSGFISGNGGLTKDGTGTLTLLTNNTNTGPVAINGGSVVVGDGGTIGALGGTGAIALGAGGELVFNRSDDLASNRLIQGGGRLVKRGAGTYNFQGGGGADVMPAEILIEEGTFHVSTGSFFTGSRLTGAGLITVEEQGTLLLQGSGHALGGTNLNVGGLQLVLNGGTMTVNNEQYVQTMTMRDGALLSGTNEIRGHNSAQSTINVEGSAPSTISARIGMGIGGFTLNVSDVTGDADADLLVTGTVAGGNGITKNGAGTVLISGNRTFTGGITLNEGVVAIDGPDAITVPNNLLGSGGILRNDAAGTMTLTAPSAAFEGTVEANGQDLWIPGGFGTGSRIEMEGQTLQLGARQIPGSLGFASVSGEPMNIDPVTTTGTTSDFSPLHNATGNVVPVNTTFVYQGEILLEGGTQYSFAKNFDDGIYLVIDGTVVINDSVWNSVVTGTFTPPETGWYSLDLRAFQGIGGVGPQGDWLAAGIGLGVRTGTETTDPADYDPFGEGAAGIQLRTSAPDVGPMQSIGAIHFAGGVPTTIEVALSDGYQVEGVISADAQEELIKSGPSALFLNGDNTFTGTTTVAEGTLGGNGTLAGELVVEDGAALNPGASVGTLSAGDTMLETGSTFVMEVDSSTDGGSSLVVNGDATIESGVTLDVVDIAETPGTLANGLVFALIEATGSVTGTFDGLPDDSIITINGVDLTLNYTASAVTLSTPPSLGTPFDDWMAGFGIDSNEPNTGLFDSFDGSGVTNIMQFALGGDPTDPANNGVKAKFTRNSDDDEELIITIAVRLGAGEFAGSPAMSLSRDGITYTVMGSLDLVDWDDDVSAVTPVQDDGGALEAPAGYELKSFRLDSSVNFPDKGFLRVEVDEEAPPAT